jgi:GMP synthase-like glutamine amidotransferase
MTKLRNRSTARCCRARRRSRTYRGSLQVRHDPSCLMRAFLRRIPRNITFVPFHPPLIPAPGIILSGSPYSVYAADAPHVDPAVFEAGVPVMGICYGLQEIARTHGGQVEPHTHREYGYAKIQVNKTGHALADKLFEGIEMEEDGGLQVRAVHH